MSAQEPTPEAARSAVAEAEACRAVVRASDRHFAAALLALAGVWVAGSVLIVVMPSYGMPAWVGPLEGLAVGLFLAVSVAIVVGVKGRQHAYTRTGNLIFLGSIVGAVFFSGAVRSVAIDVGWTVPGDPLRGLHFVLTTVISVTPMLMGAMIIVLRR